MTHVLTGFSRLVEELGPPEVPDRVAIAVEHVHHRLVPARLESQTFLCGSGQAIGVNASPATAASDALKSCLAAVPGERVVLELTEHTRFDDYTKLMPALDALRARGVRIAVDDAGAGYSGLQHVLHLRPDILKLDLDLTHGIDTDPARHALATALVGFADRIGAVLLAEGIETGEELAVLRTLGVAWGQGFYLARPGPLPLRVSLLQEPGTKSN